jgi:dsRNA-specific ribonuclease
MKAVVRESVRSRPGQPLHVWHVFRGGRCVALGTAPSRDEAETAAEAALRRLEGERLPWLSTGWPL